MSIATKARAGTVKDGKVKLLALRIVPSLHARIKAAAAIEQVLLKDFAKAALEHAVQRAEAARKSSAA